MMRKKILLLLVLFTVFFTNVFSQEFYRRDEKYIDSTALMVWISPNFSMQWNFGKGYLASLFNYNYNAGAEFTLKTQSNWTFDLGFNYMFGSKVDKFPEEFLGDMVYIQKVSDGTSRVIFNGAGNNAVDLGFEGRYWYVGASVGKIFPINRWKNSGLWLKMGLGYFEHKIHFADPNNFYPQIDQKTYRLGYDQRSQGVALTQFFGYMFMQQRRVLSFYVGVEIWEVFTKPDRGYIFAGENAGPTKNLPYKFSGMVGFKVGWILPFYEKKRITTYYTF